MKAFHLLSAPLFLFFISHVLSIPLGADISTDIITEIMTKKQNDYKQAPPKAFCTEPPGIDDSIMFRIKQNDLPGATFVAICIGDAVSRDILCSHVFEGQNVCPPETTDAERIALLLKKMDNIDLAADDGKTLLHFAAYKGWSDAVEYFLTMTKRINEPDKWGRTPLNDAWVGNNWKIVKILMSKLNFDEMMLRDLHLIYEAASEGLDDIMSILLDRTDRINEPNKYSWTPLMLAIKNGHIKIVKMLLPKIDNIDQSDRYGDTPLHFAVRKGHPGIFSLVLEKSGRINEQNGNGLTPLMLALKLGHLEFAETIVNKFDNVDRIFIDGEPLLQYAASEGLIDIVKVIVKKTRRINVPNARGWTPIMEALFYSHYDIVEVLLNNMDNVDEIFVNGESLLHYAARKGLLNIAKAIVKKTARINERNSEGRTPFMLAIDTRHDSIVGLLLNEIADVDRIFINGESLIHYAAREGLLYLMTILVDKTSRINEPNARGWTPIMLAIENSYDFTAEIILNKIGSVEDIFIGGESLLHYAAKMGSINIVKWILPRVTNIKQMNRQGLTPLAVAAQCNHREIIKLLAAENLNRCLLLAGTA